MGWGVCGGSPIIAVPGWEQQMALLPKMSYWDKANWCFKDILNTCKEHIFSWFLPVINIL